MQCLLITNTWTLCLAKVQFRYERCHTWSCVSIINTSFGDQSLHSEYHPWVWITHKGMGIRSLFVLQKESATGQKINISKHSHGIAVSSKAVRQGEQSCWALLPVALAGAVQVGRVERPSGARTRWCSVLHRPGQSSGSFCKGQCCGWLALQSFFLIEMGSGNICNNFYSTCIHGGLFFCEGTNWKAPERCRVCREEKDKVEVVGGGCCWRVQSGTSRNCLGGNKRVP